jgi:hypothetical protein
MYYILSEISSIEIMGLSSNCDKECVHFCIFNYVDKTYNTIKISGNVLVSKYWNYLDIPSQKHLETSILKK